jgi:FixJ family two-component response regulator
MIKTKPYIYVVDDDASVRRALSRLLRAAGFNADTFSSAQRKLNTLHSKLHVILITAHAQAGDRERAMEAGAIGFLQKPFNDQSLLDLIH